MNNELAAQAIAQLTAELAERDATIARLIYDEMDRVQQQYKSANGHDEKVFVNGKLTGLLRVIDLIKQQPSPSGEGESS